MIYVLMNFLKVKIGYNWFTPLPPRSVVLFNILLIYKPNKVVWNFASLLGPSGNFSLQTQLISLLYPLKCNQALKGLDFLLWLHQNWLYGKSHPKGFTLHLLGVRRKMNLQHLMNRWDDQILFINFLTHHPIL